MKPSITFGRIFGIEVGLHYSWVLIAFLIVMSLANQFAATHPEWGAGPIWAISIVTAILFFAALLAHELSHALVARAYGISTRSITLFALGGVASIENEPRDAKTEFWVGVIGPVTSAIIGAACLGAAYASGWTPAVGPDTPGRAMLVWLGYINLMLALFNLIPGFPLDGGRILRSIIWWKTQNAAKSTNIAARIGQFVGICFIALGVLRFFAGQGFGGLWIAFIGWFLLQAAGATRLQNVLVSNLEGVRVSQLMSRDCAVVDARSNLQSFVEEHLLHGAHRCFAVQRDGEVIGVITPQEVAAVDRARWPYTTVEDITLPLDQVDSVSPSTPVIEALETMGRDDVNQLPVVSDHHIEGIISRGNVLQFLQTRAQFANKS